MSSRVIKIIDHHSPSNSHSHADIYLEGVASCCTLIYRKDMENVYKILVAITILVGEMKQVVPKNILYLTL